MHGTVFLTSFVLLTVGWMQRRITTTAPDADAPLPADGGWVYFDVKIVDNMI